jgi:hypothetical protein
MVHDVPDLGIRTLTVLDRDTCEVRNDRVG